MINDLDDHNLYNNIINYWHKKFQLTKNDESIFFYPNGWLNDHHLAITMQILYV
jgi:hypothetical protein